MAKKKAYTPSKRKFYKTIYRLTVISMEPLDKDLGQDVVYDMCENDCDVVSGLDQVSVEKLNANQAIKEMQEFNGEPDWFGLTEKGEDLHPEDHE